MRNKIQLKKEQKTPNHNTSNVEQSFLRKKKETWALSSASVQVSTPNWQSHLFPLNSWNKWIGNIYTFQAING